MCLCFFSSMVFVWQMAPFDLVKEMYLVLCFANSSRASWQWITVLLLVSLDESACRVARLSVQMTIVLLRLCWSVVVTSLMAVTSAWNTEQKSGSLKNE